MKKKKARKRGRLSGESGTRRCSKEGEEKETEERRRERRKKGREKEGIHRLGCKNTITAAFTKSLWSARLPPDLERQFVIRHLCTFFYADGDTLVFIDYRADRMREIVEAFGMKPQFNAECVPSNIVRMHGKSAAAQIKGLLHSKSEFSDLVDLKKS